MDYAQYLSSYVALPGDRGSGSARALAGSGTSAGASALDRARVGVANANGLVPAADGAEREAARLANLQDGASAELSVC